MREKSLDFLGYPNYTITDDGKVFSLNYNHTGKKFELKQNENTQGYKHVCLSKNGKLKTIPVHRIVALSYLPNPDNLPEVNHKDENKQNNNVENLEWCDSKYNNNYGTRTKRSSETQLNRKDQSKQVKQSTKDGRFITDYPSIAEAERQTGFDQTAISKCCKGKLKSAYGYIWRYA